VVADNDVTGFTLHADDMGLSAGINAGIVEAIDRGFVRSVSLISNGWAVEAAVRALHDRPHVRVSLHLNLLEGEPAASMSEVPDLVDAEGRLCATFQGLACRWALAGGAQRAALQAQVSREATAQLSRGIELLGSRLGRLRVDGHTHIHALPFVSRAILDADLPMPVSSMRLPYEPLHVSWAAGDVKTMLFGANLLKVGLLNVLSARLRRQLKAHNVGFNSKMLGIAHTGAMTATAIEAGVFAARRATINRNAKSNPVEVLLHPGQARRDEAELWRGRPDLLAYYTHANRRLELESACSPAVGALIGHGERR